MIVSPVNTTLEQYKTELEEELQSILHYWMQYTLDETNGGFFGKIDNNNIVTGEAPKGAVLNARILWAFAAAYNLTGTAVYLEIANRAYAYISDHFIDKKYGGVYWSVDYKGHPLETKKQVYALSFLLYGCSEYYKCNRSGEVKQNAQVLYGLIEKYSFDNIHTGYLEAFTREWQPIHDLRLSEKDANEKKTMNTHLHVLEAYTSLYRAWPDTGLRKSIELLIKNFTEHIIGKDDHLRLFFDEEWNVKGDIISYGHDIEAAWLLLEAAEAIDDTAIIAQIKQTAVRIATATLAGLDNDGGLWYETAHGHLVKEKHSWPQAEAMVGFFTAWQITGEEKYLQLSVNSWNFTKEFIKDNINGEWFWGVDKENQPMKGMDKVGFWKCPYHSSRACIEIIHRIQLLQNRWP
ncbi:MAG: AGE family epimerase/isomerase [Ferruginibacter sp.]